MIEVAIVAFEGISLFHLSVPIAVFRDAVNHEQKFFNVRICSESSSRVTSANGLSIEINDDISVIKDADIVNVPSWLPDKVPSDFIKEQHIQANSVIIN